MWHSSLPPPRLELCQTNKANFTHTRTLSSWPPDQSLGLGGTAWTFEQEQDRHSGWWPLWIHRKYPRLTETLLECLSSWLSLTAGSASPGSQLSLAIAPTRADFLQWDRGRALNPVTHLGVFHRMGKAQCSPSLKWPESSRVFLSILCFSSSPTYLPTLPIFLLLKLPKKRCFNICPMFSRSSQL